MNNTDLNPFLTAFGWALLHFLWEATLLGLLAWIILWMNRRRGPETRYVIACGALGLMVLAFVSTMGLQIRSGPNAPLADWVSVNADNATSWVYRNETGLRQSLEAVLPAILLAWTIGACTMTARVASGLLWLHGSCLPQAKPADEGWQTRFHALAVAMGLPCTPRFLSSEKVDSPLVLGWFRPVVLVPAAAFLGLDKGMLETLLVHELAHVRRWDYLANLLQNLAEALFFFHPAVWWVSRQIRQEREHCCDDAAVRRCGDPIAYASALAALEVLRSPTSYPIHLVPAAKGGFLMHRIRRILASETTLNSSHSVLPLLTTLAVVLGVALYTSRLQAQAIPSPAVDVQALNDLIGKHAANKPKLEIGKDGAIVRLDENGNIMRLNVNDIIAIDTWADGEVHVKLHCSPGEHRFSFQSAEDGSKTQGDLLVFSMNSPDSAERLINYLIALNPKISRSLQVAAATETPSGTQEDQDIDVVEVEALYGKDGYVESVKAISGPEALRARTEADIRSHFPKLKVGDAAAIFGVGYGKNGRPQGGMWIVGGRNLEEVRAEIRAKQPRPRGSISKQ